VKQAILLLCILLSFSSLAQTITQEENQQRRHADFTSFINDVKRNNVKDCLCKAEEYVVYSFQTRSNKTASLCVSKNVSASAGYLIYRFGTKAKVELTFPADTINSFTQYCFAHYNRGGGKQNAAMYVNSFHFTNGDYTYTLHDDWNSEDDHYAKGIIITNNKTSKSTSLDAKGKATGSLWPLVNRNIVKESDEL
jgi:hypothetical protein